MKLEDMTKGYLLALYSNIESLLAKDSSWGVLDKKVNQEHIEAIYVAKKLVAKLNNSTLCAYELNGVKRWNASEVLSLAQ